MIMYRKLTFLKYLTFLVIVNSYVMDTGMCLCMIKHRNMLPFFDKFTISSSAKTKCTEKLYLNFALSPEIAMNSHRLLTEKKSFCLDSTTHGDNYSTHSKTADKNTLIMPFSCLFGQKSSNNVCTDQQIPEI